MPVVLHTTGMPQDSRSQLSEQSQSARGRRLNLSDQDTSIPVVLLSLADMVLLLGPMLPGVKQTQNPPCVTQTFVVGFFSMFWRLFYFEKLPSAFKEFFLQMIMKVEET